MSNDRIAKVAHVISDFEVVINVGRDNGVGPDARVEIYTLGDMIKDVDTGEELERLKIVRGRGRVTTLQARIATVRSIETVESPKTVRRTTANPFLSIPSGLSVVEESRGPEDAPFKKAQVGDLVRFLETRR